MESEKSFAAAAAAATAAGAVAGVAAAVYGLSETIFRLDDASLPATSDTSSLTRPVTAMAAALRIRFRCLAFIRNVGVHRAMITRNCANIKSFAAQLLINASVLDFPCARVAEGFQ
jgi:hypothetical protein